MFSESTAKKARNLRQMFKRQRSPSDIRAPSYNEGLVPEITNPFCGQLQHIIGFENEYTLSLDTSIAYVCSNQDVLTGLMDVEGKISIYCKSTGVSEYKDIDDRSVPMYEIDAIIAEDDKTVIPIEGLVGFVEKELRHKR